MNAPNRYRNQSPTNSPSFWSLRDRTPNFLASIAVVAIANLFDSAWACGNEPIETPNKPVPVIFDTDIGNDCDDVLALGMLHALQSRGECELLAVTITKDHELAAPFTDAINTFYGRGNIPIGVCRSGVTPDQGKYNGLCKTVDAGKLRYPHDLLSGKDAPNAVSVLRKALANADDQSVAIIQVGFSTNVLGLLESPADDLSPLTGMELALKKVKLLSIMAGAFQLIPNNGKMVEHLEYNVVEDLKAATKLAKICPVPIVWSGFEIGISLPYPHQSILKDFRYTPHHPLPESYILYEPPPHDRPTWDLTSVLYAVRPNHNYFNLSEPGLVKVAGNGLTTLTKDGQRDRYLILKDDQKARVIEALTLLSSQPPQ
jgi:purine nucleosidase